MHITLKIRKVRLMKEVSYHRIKHLINLSTEFKFIIYMLSVYCKIINY